MTEIKPKRVDGEKVCDANSCPMSFKLADDDCAEWCHLSSDGDICIPALRRDRDAALARVKELEAEADKEHARAVELADRLRDARAQLERVREKLKRVADQACTYDAENASEDCPCTETSACLTEYCLSCYARTVLAPGEGDE